MARDSYYALIENHFPTFREYVTIVGDGHYEKTLSQQRVNYTHGFVKLSPVLL